MLFFLLRKAVLKRLKGAFPLHFPAPQAELDGDTCYQLLLGGHFSSKKSSQDGEGVQIKFKVTSVLLDRS